MGLLDFEENYKPLKPFGIPKRYQPKENEKEWNNGGHEEVTEDFSDSPFANREKEDEKNI